VANIATLRGRGIVIVGPGIGQLTGADTGAGRMEEPDAIARAALALLDGPVQDLAGRRIVISAGGTREPLDPVRFLGNRSSGRQGVALAEAAFERGASVTLVAAHLEVPAPTGVAIRTVSTALELQAAIQDEAATADVVIMAAAVADYRPAELRADKIKKDDQTGDTFRLDLVKNPDILAGLAQASPRPAVIVGFAAETEADPARLLDLGREKIARKGCDYLVLNRVGWSQGIATEGNDVVVLDRSGDIVNEASGTKLSVANRILDVIVQGSTTRHDTSA
jgi:phosphopantothenoylcysteine decarboxylase/phosphopantothenate--cysteine ligase